MTTMFIVCRTYPSVPRLIAGWSLPLKDIEANTWDAPILADIPNNHPKLFATRAEAQAYCDRMNEEINHPKADKNGRFTIDASPYSNYVVIPIQKGTVKKPARRK